MPAANKTPGPELKCQKVVWTMQVVSEIDHLLSKQAMNLKNEEAASLRRFKQKLTDVSVL